MGGHDPKRLFGSIIPALLLAAGMASAGLPVPGEYLTDLGMARLVDEGNSFRIEFEEVVDFEIRGSDENDMTILTGGGSIPCSYAPLESGSFAIAAEGDTLYFMPLEGAEDFAERDLSAYEDSMTTYGGGGAGVEAEMPGGSKGAGETTPSRAPETPAATGSSMGDDYMGFSFSAPAGWKKGAASEGSFTLTPGSGRGTILVSTHMMNTVDDLRNSLRGGIRIAQAGTQLALAGAVQDFGDGGVAAKLRGAYRGKPVTAYNVALVSPHGGGATILAWSDPAEYSEGLEEAARSVAAAVRFRKPKEHPEVARWRSELPGNRLSYVESDFTQGLSTDGYSTGSGYSIERHLDLCSDGSFHFTESTDYSVDAGSAGQAGDASDEDHVGRWRVYRYSGFTILELRYTSGGVGALVITAGGNGVLLDGEEWSAGGSPVCP